MKPKVVVGYDHTPSSEAALAEAGREAAWRGAAITVVHAFHWYPMSAPMGYYPTDLEQSMRSAAEETAGLGVQFLNQRYPGMPAQSAVVVGPAGDALAEAARDADLLVLGNRGRGGFAGLLLGSVSIRALGLASGPTMIVRGSPRALLDTIILALDAEDPAEELLDFAFTEASCRGAHLRVINAWDLDWGSAARAEADDEVERAKARALEDVRSSVTERLSPWRTKFPAVQTDVEVVEGSPGAVLTAASAHADLVIAGARRRGDKSHGMRLGPVAQTLLHHADCPVVVVPR